MSRQRSRAPPFHKAPREHPPGIPVPGVNSLCTAELLASGRNLLHITLPPSTYPSSLGEAWNWGLSPSAELLLILQSPTFYSPSSRKPFLFPIWAPPSPATGPSLLPSLASIMPGSMSVFTGQGVQEGPPGLEPLKTRVGFDNSVHSFQAFACVVSPSTSAFLLPLHLTPGHISDPPILGFPIFRKGLMGATQHYWNDPVAHGAVIAAHRQNEPSWEATWADVGVACTCGPASEERRVWTL